MIFYVHINECRLLCSGHINSRFAQINLFSREKRFSFAATGRENVLNIFCGKVKRSNQPTGVLGSVYLLTFENVCN